jgi:hypothetical protein
MSIIDKKYRIEMPDGTHWDIPIRVIAKHRALFFASHYDNDSTRSFTEGTTPMFEQHSYEIANYARNHMTWDDVKAHAIQAIELKDMSYETGWVRGKHKITP